MLSWSILCQLVWCYSHTCLAMSGSSSCLALLCLRMRDSERRVHSFFPRFRCFPFICLAQEELIVFCRLRCPEVSAPYVLCRIMQSCTHVISALSVPKNARLAAACLTPEGFIASSEACHFLLRSTFVVYSEAFIREKENLLR